MSDIVGPLLQWLNANPHLAGLATFIVSASESVAVIGTIVPGSITMTAIGTLAGAGVIPLWSTIIWAILGAIVGDGISYWIGHYFKDRIRRAWPFKNYPGLLESGETFVHKYGVMSVFIGRYVGPVRALVPLVAGMLGMKPLQFTIANVLSAIGWAPAYMLPGIMLGAASLELPPDIAVHVMLVLLMIFFFFVVCIWSLYKLLQLFNKQTDQIQNWIWQHLRKNRALKPVTYLLKHHDPSSQHGQLNLFFYLCATGALFLAIAIYVKMNGPSTFVVNDAIYHLFRGMRTPTFDDLMMNITLLGQKQVILPVIIVMFGWLVYLKRWRAAFHFLALGVLASGSVFFFKHLIQSPRPIGIMMSGESFSMPSGHTTIATTVFIGFAFLIANKIKPYPRRFVYFTAITIALLVGISRLYLGAHWFTDVVCGWLLGATVLMIVILSYEREEESRIPPLGISLATIGSLILSVSYYHYTHVEQMRADYQMVSWPPVTLAMNEWWRKNDALPAYRASLFGFPSQAINVVWNGDIDHIRKSLKEAGWSKPPVRDWISTLHRLADVKSTQYLSMISPQYLDKRPELILARRTNGLKQLIVIRLWDANRIIKETQDPLWVGIVGVVPRTYGWLSRSHQGDINNIDPTYVFPTKKGTDSWEWKVIPMNQPTGTSKIIKQNILLIRKQVR